jgi:transposase-like protein
MALQVCPQCQRDRLVNHGSTAGKPKKPCQPCGDPLTRTTPRGTPLTTTIHAVWLSRSGIAMTRLAFRLRVSAQAVRNGIRTVAHQYQAQPEPTGSSMMLERDERWHDVQKQRQ